MRILYVPGLDLLNLQGLRGRDLAAAIELALSLGQKTIMATASGYFILGGAR